MKRNEYDEVTNPEPGRILGMENLSGLNIEAAFDLIGEIIDLSGIHDRPMVPVGHWICPYSYDQGYAIQWHTNSPMSASIKV